MSFNVIKAGFYSTIQDAGRFGFASYGLARSGALDEHAYRWANYLLDNKQTDAVLEITIGDCILQAQAPTVIAVAGADMQLTINGEAKSNWHSHAVNTGDTLYWRGAKQGMRSYLAVKGGLQTPLSYGARATNIREQIGQQLKAGDQLPFDAFTEAMTSRVVPDAYQADYGKPLALHLLPSYQFSAFSTEQMQAFFKTTYQISSASDRTAYRFTGDAMQAVPAKMVSEGMVLGSVEITTAGLPIILLNDAPTIGGYPKIGTVVSEDLAKLVQRKANTEVKFTLSTIEVTQARKREWLDFFATNIAAQPSAPSLVLDKYIKKR